MESKKSRKSLLYGLQKLQKLPFLYESAKSAKSPFYSIQEIQLIPLFIVLSFFSFFPFYKDSENSGKNPFYMYSENSENSPFYRTPENPINPGLPKEGGTEIYSITQSWKLWYWENSRVGIKSSSFRRVSVFPPPSFGEPPLCFSPRSPGGGGSCLSNPSPVVSRSPLSGVFCPVSSGVCLSVSVS